MFVVRTSFRLIAIPITFCAAVAFASDIGTEITNQISPTNYQYYLRVRLYTHDNNNRAPGMPNHTLARANIIAAFTSFGLQVEDQTFTYERTTGHNVVATKLGTVHPDSYFVISGHYDSKDNPGADDDASGVAAVMEIARVLAAYESEYTIKFMAFDMEELGMVGSSAYVNAHLSDDIRGMICMDMIAYNTGNDVAEVRGSSFCSVIKGKLNAAIAAYSQGLTAQLITESGGCSDHVPFAFAGFQACLLIEDDYSGNPCYHSPCDSVDEPDYINYAFAVKMTRSVAGYLVDNAYVHDPVNCATGEGCALGVNGDEDCNANGVWDRCDILCGASADANHNDIPDECDPCESWYVDAANCPSPGSGTQADPFCKIQDALNAASGNPNAFIDVIVADGVYMGSGNTNLDFTGKPISLRSASGNPPACVIDCQGSGRAFYFHSGETDTSVVNGFTIRNGLVTSTSPGSYYGGGVCCSSSSPTLINCAIIGNAAGSATSGHGDGGGVSCSYSSPKLIDCIIGGNAAATGGGLYCLYSASPKLINCTITDNTANYGGGICYISSVTSTLTNCTLTGNTAHTQGGALYCASSSNPVLTNCILWGDSPQEIVLDSSDPVIEYSDVQGGYAGTGNINVDPLFAFAGDVHLMPGSPCIDAGTNTPSRGLPDHDSDGNPRPLDGDGDQQALADMGAYEVNPAAPSIALDQTKIVLFAPEGQPGQDSQVLSIRNTTNVTLNWTLDWNDAWLQAVPIQGQSTGEVDTITLSADAGSLSHGVYSTTLAVTDLQAVNSPRAVEILLYVHGALYVPSGYATIQAAIDAGVPGDQIVLADGVYTGDGNKNLDFRGKAVTVSSASGNPAACIIDCQGSGRGFYFHGGETSASVINGITVRNGWVTSGSPGSYNGGGVYCSYSSPTLLNCVISGNAADVGSSSYATGGGMACSFSSPRLANCTISGNRAVGAYARGAAIYLNHSSPTLTNCTISNNNAPGSSSSDDGAIYSYASNFRLTNCILWADTPQEIHLSGAGSNPVITFSDIQGGYAGTGNINLDPLFVDPDGPDNDPNTWADNDYRLSSGSPCIDTGDPAFAQQPGETDLDGHRRTWDGDMTGGLQVDMGAYEFGSFDYGDEDCSRSRDGVDLQAFILAMLNPAGYQSAYPLCDEAVADVNGDGVADAQDIQTLIDILLGE